MKLKCLKGAFASIAVTVGLVALPSVVSAADYYVHAGVGKNTNNGTQPNAAFADLAYAMPKLRAGDTLYVRTGTYTNAPGGGNLSNGTKALPITVKPYMAEKPVISFPTPLQLNRSWWVFDNLTFQNAEIVRLGGESSGGCSYATDIVIKNSRFQHSSSGGINLYCAKRIVIAGNTFDNLRSRSADHDAHGIRMAYKVEDVSVYSNTFRDIGSNGIQMSKGTTFSNIYIVANTIEIHRPYVYRGLDGKPAPDPFGGNVGEVGLGIKGGPGPTNIVGNTIRGYRPCGSGQDCTGSNGTGIVIYQLSSGVTVKKNHFSDNIFHLRIGGDGAPTLLPNRNVEVSNNIFADTATSRTPNSIMLRNVSNVRLYNNTIYNTTAGRVLMQLENVSEVSMQNNLFHNGVVKQASSYVMDIHADHNAWSAIGGAIPSWKGLRDLKLTNPAIDWSNWKPKAGSPLIDAGMNVGILNDYYRSAIRGVGPDIGAVEY